MATVGEIGMDAAELAEVAGRLEQAGATETIYWAVERFGSGVALACSFQDLSLIHI